MVDLGPQRVQIGWSNSRPSPSSPRRPPETPEPNQQQTQQSRIATANATNANNDPEAVRMRRAEAIAKAAFRSSEHEVTPVAEVAKTASSPHPCRDRVPGAGPVKRSQFGLGVPNSPARCRKASRRSMARGAWDGRNRGLRRKTTRCRRMKGMDRSHERDGSVYLSL